MSIINYVPWHFFNRLRFNTKRTMYSFVYFTGYRQQTESFVYFTCKYNEMERKGFVTKYFSDSDYTGEKVISNFL